MFLSKTEDGSKTINLLDKILPIYKEIIKKLSSEGAEWIQIDEPYLVKDLDNEVISKIKSTLNELKSASGNSKLLVTSYFESLDKKVFDEINNSSIDAIHLDLVRGAKNIEYLKNIKNKIISLGVVDGRNIWKSNLNEKINLINNNKKDELFISSSCPLLHTPYDLDLETKVPKVIRTWLAFSKQKLEELNTIKDFINHGKSQDKVAKNKEDILSRSQSTLIHDNEVKTRVKNISAELSKRQSGFEQRSKVQKNLFKLPDYPTTTIRLRRKANL